MSRSRLLAAVGVVGVAVGGIALARQDPGLSAPLPAQGVPVAPTAPQTYSVPLTAAQAPAPVAPPRVIAIEAMTIDQLVDQVEAIRRQKAELEKREREALRMLAGKVKAQQERVSKVMVRPADGPPRAEVIPIVDPIPGTPVVER